ncbi:hypothetical protein MNBD_GAMMA12-3062 [hydrothermal vent metagenome]|uniref:Type VI secretion system-associated protein TagF n=1 Tax=hydrothermal vent metagenome TaxID=652676 RepID=A0A3B0YGD8_9ZZZZ
MKDVLSALFSSRQETKKNSVNEASNNTEPEPQPIVDDVVGCIGKLPLYADFLRHNLHNAEAIALDKWMQSGFQHLSQKRRTTFKEVFNRFPRLEFMLFGDDNLRPISGVMVAGKDQSGREYPFTIFKVMGAAIHTSQIPLLPSMLSVFHHLAIDLCHEKWVNEEKNVLFKRIDALPINEFHAGEDYLRRQSRSQLEVLSSQWLWDTILPVSSLERRMEFIKIFNHKLRSILALPMASRQWGIEINIFNSEKRDMVQQFFVTLIVMLLGHKLWNGQSWLSDSNGAESRLTLFFRPIAAEDFLTLVDFEAGRNNLMVINDLLDEADLAVTAENYVPRQSSSLAGLLKDWVLLYEKKANDI